MNPVETIKAFDDILSHLDQMLKLDDEQLHSALDLFTQEHPGEGFQLLNMLRDRHLIEEERIRVMQMKIDYISEWQHDFQTRVWQDPQELDEVLKMLNVNPGEINESDSHPVQVVL